MVESDEDALACDLAETYGILDTEALPIKKLAVLSCGLRENSRIKMKMSGSMVSSDTLILAAIFDTVNAIACAGSKKRPDSMVRRLTQKETDRQCRAFLSPEAFEAERKRICHKAAQQ